MPNGLAMVLSGGGAKGAFQVGVMDALITGLGINFDCFVGVSTGSIQALGGAMDDVPGLLNQWKTIRNNDDVYTHHATILGGLLGADALYDAKPLRKKLAGFADEAKLRATGKKMLLGVVNLQSGEFRTVDERASDIADWVYASCAMPVYFKPLLTRDAAGVEEQWVDGGVRDVTPLKAAMEQNPRAILVVRASPPPKPAVKTKKFNSLIKVGLRATEIQQAEVSINDIEQAGLINDLLKAREAQTKALSAAGVSAADSAKILAPLNKALSDYRFTPIYVIEPEENFSDTLDFSKTAIDRAIAGGRAIVARDEGKIRKFLAP